MAPWNATAGSNAFAHYLMGQYDASLSWAREALYLNPNHLQVLAIRAAAVTVGANGSGPVSLNAAECEIVFVEFLGDLVKLHLLAGGERMLAKVGAEQYPALRGREGQQVWISWKEEDGQLLDA